MDMKREDGTIHAMDILTTQQKVSLHVTVLRYKLVHDFLL